MKVLVTGVKGQLGYDVVNELTKRGIEAVGVDIQDMDITDAASVEKVIGEVAPDAVIHCAAYTAVDAAEDNVELCRRVNADGTQNIANVCKKLDCKMIYISTDYVFDGEGTRAWEPDDERHPLNVFKFRVTSNYRLHLLICKFKRQCHSVKNNPGITAQPSFQG